MKKTSRVKSSIIGALIGIAFISTVRASDPNVVATPVFTPDGGTYNTEQNVMITCATPGATIRYTLDGSDPNEGNIYEPNSVILIDHTLTLKAKAWKDSLTPVIAVATYNLTVAAPMFTPGGGIYESDQTVVITCADSEAEIRYTTDSSDPVSGTLIENGGSIVVSVDPPTTLKAQAFKTGWSDSFINTALYKQPGGIIYVKASATGDNNGSSWTNAYTDLQSALSAAVSGNEIWVAAGTYVPSESFQLKNGVALYGGFNGTESSRQQRDYAVNVTNLSGGDNGIHVIYNLDLDSTAILDGFTVRDGYVFISYPDPYFSGDGYAGGGMYNHSSSPTIRNCIFTHNTTSAYYWWELDPFAPDVQFASNTQYAYLGWWVEIGQGGGMYNSHSNPVLINCVFERNNSNCAGGAMTNDYSNPVLINCTFTNNIAPDGGAIRNSNSNPVITNCIFWNDSGGEFDNDSSSTPVVTYSDIQGGYSGTGNINSEPNFVNTAGGDLRLNIISLCIDAGNSAAVPADITTDLAGEPRIVDGNCDNNVVVDMGAYEYYQIGNLDTICGVTLNDFNLFSKSWLETGCEKPDNCNQADIDRNGTVELDDLILFADHWLEGM
jgi:hypothetical protein